MISVEHIRRMEKEYEELEEKGIKLQEFLEKEMKEPKFTNEKQRLLLGIQMTYMKNYLMVLEERIENDKELLEK